MLNRAFILLVAIALTSCVSTKKSKSTVLTKSDSTHSVQKITTTTAKSDEIATRQITFTANKITEIDWIRDTTFKDTIVYRKRIRIIEETRSDETQQTHTSKADSTTEKTDSKTEVKSETKSKEKDKQSKPSPMLLSIPFLVLLILVALYLLKRYRII